MSDKSEPPFGQARPARHSDISSKFGGLLSPVRPEIPEQPAGPKEDVAAVPVPVEDQTSKTPSDVVGGEPTAAPATTSASQPDTAPAVLPRRASPRPTASEPAPGKPGKADQPVAINLPTSIGRRLDSYRRSTGLSNPNIVFNALEATYERLPALIQARTVQLGASGGEDSGPTLFSRPQTAVRRDDTGEAKKPLIIRITEANKQVLADLITTVNAPNRSVMVVAALDDFLPTNTD